MENSPVFFKNFRYSRNIQIFKSQYELFQQWFLRLRWREQRASDKTSTENFHDNLTLSKSTGKCWLERDLNSHFRETGPPLYLLSYRGHRDWKRVFKQLKCTRYFRDNFNAIHERMCSTAVDRYPKSASSNPARVNILEFTSAASDYHENFLFMYLWEWLWNRTSMSITKVKHVKCSFANSWFN